VVSDYQKGALVALALDLAIRAMSGGTPLPDGRDKLACGDSGAWPDRRTGGSREDGIVDAVTRATAVELGGTSAMDEGSAIRNFDIAAGGGDTVERKIALDSPAFCRCSE